MRLPVGALLGWILLSGAALAADDAPATLDALRAALDRVHKATAEETAVLEETQREMTAAAAAVSERAGELSQAREALLAARERRAVAERRDFAHTDDVAGYLAALDTVVQRRLDDLGRRADAFRAATLERARLQQARETSLQRLAELSAESARLRSSGEERLRPPHLRSVTLSVPDLRDQSSVVLYESRWEASEDYARLERRIGALAAAVTELERMLPLLQEQVGKAEERLLQADQEWQRFEVDDPTLAWVEAVVAALLRPGDRVIAWIGEDPLLDVLSYEWGRTVLDAVLGVDRPAAPGLADQIVQIRSEFASAAVSDALAELDGRPVSLIDIAKAVEGMAPPPRRESEDALEMATLRAAEALRDAAGDLPAGSLRPDALWPALFAGWLASAAGRPAENAVAAARQLLQAPASNLERLRAALSRGAPDAGMNIISRFREQITWQDAARDALAGAVVLLEGSVVTDALSSERGQSFYEMALKEIEWLVRRNELHAATDLLHVHQSLLRSLEEVLRRTLDERRAGCCVRRLVRSVGRDDEPIVVTDWQWSQIPELALVFDRPLHSFGYRFAETEAWRTLRPDGAVVVVPLVRDIEFGHAAMGRFTLEVQALSEAGVELDARPETGAVLARDLQWIDADPGPDRRHGFDLARPALTVLDHDPSDLPGGAVFEVGYLAPRPTRSSGWIGIFPAGAPQEAAITDAIVREYIVGPAEPGGRDRRLRLAAPMQAGRYELRMYDRVDGGVMIANAPIAVRRAAADLRSLHLIAAVPEQTEGAAAAEPDAALRVGEGEAAVVPRRLGVAFAQTVSVGEDDRVFLAGDPMGQQPWGVDNFLLVEIEEGDEVRRLVIGEAEAVFYGEEELPHLGTGSLTFGPNDIDLSSELPRGTPFTLRVSAFDYGAPGWVSDVYLILRPR